MHFRRRARDVRAGAEDRGDINVATPHQWVWQLSIFI